MEYQSAVLNCYQEKNYVRTLTLIDDCPIATIRESSHYRILRAICLVNLGIDIELVHQILDKVLQEENENEFAYFVKGLAYSHEKKMDQAIESFDKAIEMDKLGAMDKAKQLRKKAFETKNGEVKKTEETDSETTIIEEEERKIGASKIGLKGEKVQDGNNNKTCKICNKTFTKPFGLKRHMLLHSGGKPHRCPICSFGFAEKVDLEQHINTHNSTSLFNCSDCKKTFKTKKGIQAHQLCHVQNTVNSIEAAIDITDNTESHHDLTDNAAEHVPIPNIVTQIAVEERTFKCTKCPKTFKLESLLRYHESLHNTGFECDHCGRKFSNRGNLTTHIWTHGLKQFGCNLCSFTYSSIMKLGTHFREFHGVGKKGL